MKYTLLELTQNVLSSMDSDEIVSIDDSVESQQVANLIRTVYYDIIDRANLPEHYSLVNLTESSISSPVLMTLPTSVSKIMWVKYDKRLSVDSATTKRFDLVNYMNLENFLDRMHQQNIDDTTVDTFTHTVGGNSFSIMYRNDISPEYYTSFDDNTLVFESYDSTVDTFLRTSKSLCYAKTIIPFNLVDSFVPDLDEEQFSLLLNESKSLAWAELKQTMHQKAELNSRRGWSRLQKNKYATENLSDLNQLPYFGRR